jgi:N-acetylmuramoyl-L-alanine amidase
MKLPIINKYPSPYHRSRGGLPVSLLVLHYTVDDFSQAYKDFLYQPAPNSPVSVNYLIDEKPTAVYQLVPEERASYHAGLGKWQNVTNVNNASIGIELVNKTNNIPWSPSLVGWVPFEPDQIKALIVLAKDIIARFKIDPTCVIGHSDSGGFDPTTKDLRKIDPGPLFPWKKLYRHGIGAWPDKADVTAFRKKADPNDIKNLQTKLQRYGYAIEVTGQLDEQTKAFVKAFKMHFNPEQDDKGQVDSYISTETVAILEALVKKYRPDT